jgi:sialic acid synthase SpsE
VTYVIAEAGSNHDGDFRQAVELIEVAVEAKCDAVKFQCIPPLERGWMPALQAMARDRGIAFLATPFDLDAVAYLDSLDVPAIKIAAPELVYLELIEAAAKTGKPLIISTGMATVGEIEQALETADLASDLPEGAHVTLLQCTTRYPTPAHQINLRAMEAMRNGWHTAVGLSDHSLGIAVPIAAAALGASIIEKHFTISRDLKGPDHPFAIEPHELKAMVDGIREVEKALGDGRKDGPVEGELTENRGRRLTWDEGVGFSDLSATAEGTANFERAMRKVRAARDALDES